MTQETYQTFAPLIDQQIKTYGKLRIVFEMRDFHGWTGGAIWEDIKFDFKHWKDIERVAIVGDARWESGMATFCKPFTLAKIRYFDISDIDDAMVWVAHDESAE